MRLLISAALLALAAPAAAQLAAVDGGTVRGKVLADGTEVFRGIPFAAPPVEDLRWKPPQPIVPWRGTRDATGEAASCVQNDQGWNHADFLSGREDCLTLDVRTPSVNGHLPVLVWIHGGSNRAGGPNDIVMSDVGKQVVIVGVRYRLGIFGFLSHPELTAEQGGSGNYGLMDQVAALKWVRGNIAKFGGDPDRVTIAGESAGSQDVSLLLAAPPARGLFKQAIMESGTPGFGIAFRTLSQAERIGRQASDILGAENIGQLRKMSVPALLAADLKLHDETMETDDGMWLRTTIDGKLLPASPRELLERAPLRPVILGSNLLEYGADRPHRDAIVAKAFGPKNEAAARSFYGLDGPSPAPDPRMGTIDEQIGTDVVFRCPTEHVAELLAAKGAAVWRYEFDASPNGGKTSHAAEIAFAFGDAKFGPGLSLMPYWVDFIRTGDPNGNGLARWPRFTPQGRQHVLFDSKGATVEGPIRPTPCALEDRL